MDCIRTLLEGGAQANQQDNVSGYSAMSVGVV